MKTIELVALLKTAFWGEKTFDDYEVVTSDGVVVTGVWIEHDRKQIVLVQPSKTTREYMRVGL